MEVIATHAAWKIFKDRLKGILVIEGDSKNAVEERRQAVDDWFSSKERHGSHVQMMTLIFNHVYRTANEIADALVE